MQRTGFCAFLLLGVPLRVGLYLASLDWACRLGLFELRSPRRTLIPRTNYVNHIARKREDVLIARPRFSHGDHNAKPAIEARMLRVLFSPIFERLNCGCIGPITARC
jgi:hypothetical protein